jgi:hypothetical protein
MFRQRLGHAFLLVVSSFLLICVLLGKAQSQAVKDAIKPRATVTLSNGDVISGDLVAESTDRITVRNPVVGNVEIPRNGISAINRLSETQLSSSRDFKIESVAQQNSIETSSPQTQPAKATGASTGFVLSKLKISLSLLGATQKQQTYSGELDLTKNWHTDKKGWPHQRSLLILSPTYDDKRNPAKPPANITRNYNAILQHMFYTSSDNLYVPLLANLYHNNSLGIYLQQTYGGGVGRTFGALELDADLRFIGEHLYTPPKSSKPIESLGLIGAGLSERYDLSLGKIKAGAKLTQSLEFVPVFDHAGAWQGHGIVGISIPFTQQLSFVVSAFDNYVQNAPPTFNKNYFKTTVGIQYSPAAPKK